MQELKLVWTTAQAAESRHHHSLGGRGELREERAVHMPDLDTRAGNSIIYSNEEERKHRRRGESSLKHP